MMTKDELLEVIATEAIEAYEAIPWRGSTASPDSEPATPLCPQCGGPLHEAEQSPTSKLNREQWLATRAGDYYCMRCPDNNRGKQPVAYFWAHEVGKAQNQ